MQQLLSMGEIISVIASDQILPDKMNLQNFNSRLYLWYIYDPMSFGQSYGSTKKIVKQGVRNIQTHKLLNVEKSQTSSDLNPMGIICNLGKSQRTTQDFLHLFYT